MGLAFDDVELDLAGMRVLRGGQEVPVEPQVFDVLAYLVTHRGRLVPKTELLDEVWGDRFVSESALTSRIKSARRAIGDSGQEQRRIQTVHGRGYRFVGAVDEDLPAAEPVAPRSSAPPEAALPGQTVRFCTTEDGARLAWTRLGTGPVLVKAANWLSHLEFDWESTVWRHWLRELTARHDLVRYDERGCGLSDWETDRFSFEAWVDDLRAVADAAGVDRFPLLGVSQGAAVAVAFAAAHPERVSCLVLYGGYVLGPVRRATTPEATRAASLLPQLAELGWGTDDPAFRQVFSSRFMPDAPKEQWEEFNELQRRSTSPTNAARFLEAFGEIDVTEAAASVRAPALVVHVRGDRMPPLAQGRALASLLPNSRFVSLEGDNHLIAEDEPAWPAFLDEVDCFLAEHA